jgi:ABC-type transporter Mla maintaining outer membrane lipid asymmetry permease subunit MlaE
MCSIEAVVHLVEFFLSMQKAPEMCKLNMVVHCARGLEIQSNPQVHSEF